MVPPKPDSIQEIYQLHPSLSGEACIALTLREVCGLTTEAIAHACLRTPTTLAQRIVRAKAKIRDAGIPYQVPDKDELPAQQHLCIADGMLPHTSASATKRKKFKNYFLFQCRRNVLSEIGCASLFILFSCTLT
jgi:hypothetical protein